MELREINTFVQVARFQSFSRAAAHLGYSQAAVTIQIKQLEQELGVHLFDRIGKQITLTHQGEVFFEYAASVLRDLSRAKEAVSSETELTGQLCIGAIESVSSCLLPAVLETYHRLHPKVRLRIVTESPEALLDMMNQNVIDIVYFMDKRMYDRRWIKVLEEPEQIVFVCAPEHPLAGKEGVCLDQLVDQSFILTERNASYRFLLDQYLASENRRIRPFLETGNTEFIIRFLKKGMGISFLPAFTVSRELEEGSLVTLDVKNFRLQIWRQMVHHKDKWLNREMAEFIRLARNENRLFGVNGRQGNA